MFLSYIFLKLFDVGGTTAAVDVCSVRLVVDHICLGADGIKHALGYGRGTSVGAVESDSHVFKGFCRNRDQVSNVAVSSGCKIHGASDVFSRCERDLRCSVVDVGFDLRFDVGFQFLSQAVDDFDSVVIERVVAGGDHNSAVKVFGTDNIGNARGGRYVQQISVCSRCGQSCYQRIFEHVAGASGVFSNDDLCFVVFSEIPSEESSHFICMLNRQINVCFSAKSICSKIFTHGMLLSPFGQKACLKFFAIIQTRFFWLFTQITKYRN